MLPKSKVALIQVAKRELGLSDEDYRALLLNYGGKVSATRLDNRGFKDVMDRFAQLGFVSSRARKEARYGNRAGMATPAQLTLIRDIWAEVAKNPTDRHLDAWLDVYAGISSIRFLSFPAAGFVIGALRMWQARHRKAGAKVSCDPGNLQGLTAAQLDHICAMEEPDAPESE